MRKYYFFLLALFFLGSYSIQACSYTDDPELKAQKSECGAKTASQWSCQQNRCLTTAESKAQREAYQECSLLEAQEAKNCYDILAQSDTEGLTGKESKASIMAPVLGGIFAAFYGLQWAFAKESSTCTSGKIATGAGVAGLATHIFVKMTAEKKLKKLRDKYKAETVNDDSYQAQKRAFDYLKEEQELIAKLSKTRKMTYFLVTALYGAAAGMAAYEMITLTTYCGGNFASPPIILGTSLAASVYSIILGIKASKQEKDAKENAEKIAAILAQFEEGLEAFCPLGREDLNDAKCYCSNQDKSRNEDRSNSETCINYWASLDQKITIDPKAKAELLASEAKGCVALDGKFDADCKCKHFTDPKSGKNACYKASFTTDINGPGSLFSLPTLADNIETISKEGVATNTLNANDLLKNAINNSKIRDKLIAMLNKKRKKKNLAPFTKTPAFLDKFVKKYGGKANLKAAEAANANSLAFKNRPQNSAISDALKKIAKIKPSKKKLSFSGGQGQSIEAKKKDFKFNFNGEAGSHGQKVQNFMLKKYDYDNADIGHDESASLFKIITNRYLNSGLKRLFPD